MRTLHFTGILRGTSSRVVKKRRERRCVVIACMIMRAQSSMHVINLNDFRGDGRLRRQQSRSTWINRWRSQALHRRQLIMDNLAFCTVSMLQQSAPTVRNGSWEIKESLNLRALCVQLSRIKFGVTRRKVPEEPCVTRRLNRDTYFTRVIRESVTSGWLIERLRFKR
jgi:hypothetical protein